MKKHELVKELVASGMHDVDIADKLGISRQAVGMMKKYIPKKKAGNLKVRMCKYCKTSEGLQLLNNICNPCQAIAGVLRNNRNKSNETLEEEIARMQEIIEIKRKIINGVHPLTGKPLKDRLNN